MSGAAPVAGRRAVVELLRARRRRVDRLYLLRGGRGGILKEVADLATGIGVPIEELERGELDRLAGGDSHQGVVAMATPPEAGDWTLDDVLARARGAGEPPFVVVLDELKDPQNVGAIVRTAEAAGAHGVVTTLHRSAPAGEGVARASAGAVEHLPLVAVVNLRDALERLKAANVWVLGADMGGAKPYTEADLAGPVALVLGEEGKGLRDLTRKSCDELIAIPLKGKVGSLNVSATAAVLCYEAVRQRGRREKPA